MALHQELLSRKFIRYYLPVLQMHNRWQKDRTPLQRSIVVMNGDPQLPRALLPIGYITKVIPSIDGKIRTAEIQVNDRSYT